MADVQPVRPTLSNPARRPPVPGGAHPGAGDRQHGDRRAAYQFGHESPLTAAPDLARRPQQCM